MRLIFGFHAVQSILSNAPRQIKKIHIDRNRQDEKVQALLQQAQRQGVAFEYTTKAELVKLVGDEVHQGVVAQCEAKEELSEQGLFNLLAKLSAPAFFLVLDGVQDPHNLGACFRSADAAGVHAIIVPKDNAVGITAATEKVASGATQTIPFVRVTNLARTLRHLKEQGVWCYGLSDKVPTSIYQADFRGPMALVMGAENKGIRPNVLKQCDSTYKIPMQGYVSSLNVAVATGICLFEALRQRL